MASFDGDIFVTPEYNHSITGALKNAIDYLYVEWHNKAVGFVSYGLTGGTRAVEHLRLIMSELQIPHVRAQVALSLSADFTNRTDPTPGTQHERTLHTMLDQLIAWSDALKTLRPAEQASAAIAA